MICSWHYQEYNMEKTLRVWRNISRLKTGMKQRLNCLWMTISINSTSTCRLRLWCVLLFRESIKQLVLAGAADCKFISALKNHLLYSIGTVMNIAICSRSWPAAKPGNGKDGGGRTSRQFEVQKASRCLVKIRCNKYRFFLLIHFAAAITVTSLFILSYASLPVY